MNGMAVRWVGVKQRVVCPLHRVSSFVPHVLVDSLACVTSFLSSSLPLSLCHVPFVCVLSGV